MSEPSARKEFPLKQIGTAIANLYARLQPKRSAATVTPSANYDQDEAKTQKALPTDAVMALDNLPITNTITRRWPLAKLNYPAFVRTEEPSLLPPPLQSPLRTVAPSSEQSSRLKAENYPGASLAEDETEEMDALPGNTNEA